MPRKVSEMSEKEIQKLLKDAQERNYRVRGHTAATASDENWDNMQAGFVPNVRVPGVRGFVTPGNVAIDPEKAFGKEVMPAKRTASERADSLGGRLWKEAQTNPEIFDMLMRRIQGEAWRHGKTPTYEEVRRVAAQFLGKAEAEAKK